MQFLKSLGLAFFAGATASTIAQAQAPGATTDDLAALVAAEQAHFAKTGSYQITSLAPATLPSGGYYLPWTGAGYGWAALGWAPSLHIPGVGGPLATAQWMVEAEVDAAGNVVGIVASEVSDFDGDGRPTVRQWRTSNPVVVELGAGAPIPTGGPRMITSAGTSDRACSRGFDYCLTATCNVRNVGDAPGEAEVGISVVRKEGAPLQATQQVQVAAGQVLAVNQDFPKAGAYDLHSPIQCTATMKVEADPYAGWQRP